jgi:hypothetical protein
MEEVFETCALNRNSAKTTDSQPAMTSTIVTSQTEFEHINTMRIADKPRSSKRTRLYPPGWQRCNRQNRRYGMLVLATRIDNEMPDPWRSVSPPTSSHMSAESDWSSFDEEEARQELWACAVRLT